MIIAAKRGHFDLVKTIVALGADIDKGIWGDGNPLIMAISRNHKDIATFLIEQGANVNYEISGDETPLIKACAYGYFDLVKQLIANGADVNQSSRDGYFFNSRLYTPLKMARKFEYPNIEKYLIEHGATN